MLREWVKERLYENNERIVGWIGILGLWFYVLEFKRLSGEVGKIIGECWRNYLWMSWDKEIIYWKWKRNLWYVW